MLFGVYLHRIYGVEQPGEALARTRVLYQNVYGMTSSNDIWSGTANVPAVASVSPKLPSPAQKPPKAALFAAVEDEDLEWLGVAVARELPLKQAVCKKSEPLRKIAITDPAATVAEYKKFLRLMVDEKGAWFTPSKLVDELWHRHMLDTVAYCKFCARVNGDYLHHTPHYGKPHSYHDPGFMATLQAYKDKFADTPPNAIWGTVGESGGITHSIFEGPSRKQCFVYLACPCICVIIIIGFQVVYGVYLAVHGLAADVCREDMAAEATACSQSGTTPVVGSDGDWVLPYGYVEFDSSEVSPATGTSLGTCADRTMDDSFNGTMPWRSNNSSRGEGKTCDDYRVQQLCKLCEGQFDVQPGGTGWKPEWGSPADLQYANGGMTAVDACCACGGGNATLADPMVCNSFTDGCEKIDDCADAHLMYAVAFVCIVGGTGYFVMHMRGRRKKQRDWQFPAAQAETTQTAVDGTAVAAAAVPDTGMTVNPLNAATAVAMAQPATLHNATTAMQVQVPHGSGPGQPMLVDTPAGQMQVIVPAGVMPGMAFQINIPTPAPTAVATAVPTPTAKS